MEINTVVIIFQTLVMFSVVITVVSGAIAKMEACPQLYLVAFASFMVLIGLIVGKSYGNNAAISLAISKNAAKYEGTIDPKTGKETIKLVWLTENK